MENINELEIRRLLRKKPGAAELLRQVIAIILNPQKSWEDRRTMWHFLYRWGKESTILAGMIDALGSKGRLPFDIMIEITAKAKVKPGSTVIESVLKGTRKQQATDELISARAWDKYDKRFAQVRKELVDRRVDESHKAKEAMIDKFNFLKGQRLVEQAGRVLRRLLEIYPEDRELKKTKQAFDDEWAREVLSTHLATLGDERMEQGRLITSPLDIEMLKRFAEEGEKIALNHREFAAELAMGFLFMDEFKYGVDILAWAEVNLSNEWLRAELLVLANRYVEALEQLNHIEVKYANDPETSFGVSYLRAQCFRELGQKDAALEIMQSIVRVRPNYRSAQSLVLEWTEGANWE